MADDGTTSEVARAGRRALADELYDLRCALAGVEYGEPPFFTDEQVAHKRQRAAELEPLVGNYLDTLLAADDHADAASAADTLATRERQSVGMPTAELARTLAAREVWSKLEPLALILVEDGGVDLATAVRWLAAPDDELDGHSPASWAEAGRDPEHVRTVARRAAARPLD